MRPFSSSTPQIEESHGGILRHILAIATQLVEVIGGLRELSDRRLRNQLDATHGILLSTLAVETQHTTEISTVDIPHLRAAVEELQRPTLILGVETQKRPLSHSVDATQDSRPLKKLYCQFGITLHPHTIAISDSRHHRIKCRNLLILR